MRLMTLLVLVASLLVAGCTTPPEEASPPPAATPTPTPAPTPMPAPTAARPTPDAPRPPPPAVTFPTPAAPTPQVPPGASASPTPEPTRSPPTRTSPKETPASPTPVAVSPSPSTATPTPPAPQPRPAQGALVVSAAVDDPQPCQNSVVNVAVTVQDGGAPVAGADVTSNWKYKTTTSSETGITSSDGSVVLSRPISRATPGYPVNVEVVAVHEGQTGHAMTQFTPVDCPPG